MPACPKCGHRAFSISQIEPIGARYVMYAVHCASITCQTVVGVTEYYDAGSLLKKQEKAIAALDARLSNLEHSMRNVELYLRQR